jgi:hypothetical protein
MPHNTRRTHSTERLRRATTTVTLAAALSLILCGGVAAQSVEDKTERATYQFGRFAIDTGGWFAISHDPNITRESKDTAIGGWESHASPQIRARAKIGAIDVAAVSALEYIKLTDPTAETPTLTGQPWANVLAAVRAGQSGGRVAWLVDWSGKDTNARPTGFEVGARSRHVDRTFHASTDFRLAPRVVLTARGSRSRVGYDADAVYRDSQLSVTLDKTATTAGASFGLLLTPLTNVFVSTDRQSETYHRTPERNNTGFISLGGVSFKTGALLSGVAAAGYRSSQTTFGTHPLNSPYATVSLVHNRPSGATIAFILTKDKQFSYDRDQGAVATLSTELQGVVPPFRGWNVYWSFVRANLAYEKPTARSEAHSEYIVGTSHRLFSRMRVGGMVNGYRRDAGDAGDADLAYGGTRISLFVVVGATHWMRQLDLPLPRF